MSLAEIFWIVVKVLGILVLINVALATILLIICIPDWWPVKKGKELKRTEEQKTEVYDTKIFWTRYEEIYDDFT